LKKKGPFLLSLIFKTGLTTAQNNAQQAKNQTADAGFVFWFPTSGLAHSRSGFRNVLTFEVSKLQ
jgi:hypothetical protein